MIGALVPARVNAPTRLASAPPITNSSRKRREPSARSADTPNTIRNSRLPVRCSQSAWMKIALTRRAARSSVSCCSHGALASSRVAGTVPQRDSTASRCGAGSVASQRNTITQAATISSVAHGGPCLRRLGSCTNTRRASAAVARIDEALSLEVEHDAVAADLAQCHAVGEVVALDVAFAFDHDEALGGYRRIHVLR